MVTNVYAWPPVGLTGWEITWSHPVSRSKSFIDGRPRTSSYQTPRRLATAVVPGINTDQAGAGYIETLKRLIEGGRHLVRVEAQSSIWHLARADRQYLSGFIEWRDDSANEIMWTAGLTNDDVRWYGGNTTDLEGAPTTDGIWPAIRVTGFPPDVIVVRPGERLRVFTVDAEERADVLNLTRSDADGVAIIRLIQPVTLTGFVSLGDKESIVFDSLSPPRAIQPSQGNWSYQWNFQEVFANEYADGWQELDPWN